MKILIRSQNKRELVNLDTIETIYIDSMCRVKAICDQTYNATLGEYSSFEHAMKAIDMIQEHYMFFLQGYPIMPKVFLMPEDSEVDSDE